MKEAKEKGYTEPDPRDDLNGKWCGPNASVVSDVTGGSRAGLISTIRRGSLYNLDATTWRTAGMDVARKVVILGRVSGLNVGLDSMMIENVVPKELQVCAPARTSHPPSPSVQTWPDKDWSCRVPRILAIRTRAAP